MFNRIRRRKRGKIWDRKKCEVTEKFPKLIQDFKPEIDLTGLRWCLPDFSVVKLLFLPFVLKNFVGKCFMIVYSHHFSSNFQLICFFMSVWTHSFLFYLMGHNPLVLFIFLLKLSWMAPVSPFSLASVSF